MSPQAAGIRRNLLLLSSIAFSCSVYDDALLDASVASPRDAQTDSNRADTSTKPAPDGGDDDGSAPTPDAGESPDETDAGDMPVAGRAGAPGAGVGGHGAAGAGAGGHAAQGGGGASATCGEGETGRRSSDGHCYFVLAPSVTWSVGRDDCQRAGAELATLTSQAEHTFVLALLDDQPCWIGLSRFGSASFLWITKETFVFTAWKTGAPTQSGERGVLLDPATDAWVDASPGELHCAICEQDAP